MDSELPAGGPEMDDQRSDEVLELDPDHVIAVEITREWPRYVAGWSIRKKVGETDYPVQSGRIERMPPRDPAQLDAMLDQMRSEAREAAMQAARLRGEHAVTKDGGSLLGRLFRRNAR